MRNVFFYTMVLVIFVMLNGCCHKKHCEDFEHIGTMTLYNFTAADADSISIEVFEITSNGKVRLDSILTQGFQSSNSSIFTVYMPESLQQYHNYRVTIRSTNQVYLLADFTKQNTSCNNCFIEIMNDDYIALYSYTVNGLVQYYQDLRIMN